MTRLSIVLYDRVVVALNVMYSSIVSDVSMSVPFFESISSNLSTMNSSLSAFAASFGWVALSNFDTFARNKNLKGIQLTVVQRIRRLIARFLVCRRDLSGSLSDDLDDLKSSFTLQDDAPVCMFNFHPQNYFQSACAEAVQLRSDLVKLPTDFRSVPLMDLLPEHAASLLRSPSAGLLLDDVVSGRQVTCMLISRCEYVALVRRLCSAGLFGLTESPSVTNGLFGVPKSDGSLRLIVDARPANVMFRSPPAVALPSPAVFTHLMGKDSVNDYSSLYIAKTDIDNFYHRLALPVWLRSYFCFPPLPASAVDVTGKFGRDDPELLLYPCCLSLPMGWSFSVYFAQLAHEHIIYSRSSLRPIDNMTHPFFVSLAKVRHLVYIDDVIFVGSDCATVLRSQLDYIRAIESAGLLIKRDKLVWPTSTPVKCLGLMVDGSTNSVRLAPEDMSILLCDTLRLINMRVISGRALSRVIGRWIWALLPVRPLLSVLSSSFRFALVAGNSLFELWPSVKTELLMLCFLAPLITGRLQAPVFDRVLVSDSSLSGFGVMACAPNDVSSRLDMHLADFGSNAGNYGSPPCQSSVLPGGILPIFPSRLLSCITRWIPLFGGSWRSLEHINVLELRAAELALRWLASCNNVIGTRVFLLSDSQVVVYGLRKGRFSSKKLLAVYRRLAALILSMELQVYPYWIPSRFNPADELSRGL